MFTSIFLIGVIFRTEAPRPPEKNNTLSRDGKGRESSKAKADFQSSPRQASQCSYALERTCCLWQDSFVYVNTAFFFCQVFFYFYYVLFTGENLKNSACQKLK
jgi:hypothetical protein